MAQAATSINPSSISGSDVIIAGHCKSALQMLVCSANALVTMVRRFFRICKLAYQALATVFNSFCPYVVGNFQTFALLYHRICVNMF